MHIHKVSGMKGPVNCGWQEPQAPDRLCSFIRRNSSGPKSNPEVVLDADPSPAIRRPGAAHFSQ